MTGFIDNFNTDTKAAFAGLLDDATWIRTAGGSAEIKVEFSNEPLKDDLGNVINVDNPKAWCHAEDVPGVVVSDVLAVQDAQYTITDVLDYGDGGVDLLLRKLS